MEKVKYSDEFICPKCGRHTALVFYAGGGHQAHCLFCDLYYDIEIAKPTNADRIRAMSDEELAKWMAINTDCCYCKARKDGRCDNLTATPCDSVWLDWLKQEATDGFQR